MTHDELSAAGFEVNAVAYRRLAAYVRALLEENSTLNLTAIRAEADIWALHICDSLALLPMVDSIGGKRVLDIGTGCGSPGIPLACARDSARLTLLDGTRKKIDAVARMIEAIGLKNAAARWDRAEEMQKRLEWRGRFDAIAARAVGPLEALVAFGGFLRPGGRGWFFKSTKAEAEIETAGPAAKKNHMTFVAAHRYTLPTGHGERMIVEYQKR